MGVGGFAPNWAPVPVSEEMPEELPCSEALRWWGGSPGARDYPSNFWVCLVPGGPDVGLPVGRSVAVSCGRQCALWVVSAPPSHPLLKALLRALPACAGTRHTLECWPEPTVSSALALRPRAGLEAGLLGPWAGILSRACSFIHSTCIS